MSSLVRVCHVSTGLRTGGAERMLAKVVRASRALGISSSVVSLSEPTSLEAELRQEGIAVTSLGLAARPSAAWRAALLRRAIDPSAQDLVHGWMYHANLAATLAAGRCPLVWCVRGSLSDIGNEKWHTRIAIRLGARLSSRPRRIVYDSAQSRTQHETIGFSGARAEVIPNGFDVDEFSPDPASANRFRRSLGLTPDALVLGHVARWHPMKGHALMVEALAAMARTQPRLRALFAGRGVDDRNAELVAQLAAAGLADRVVLLGEQRNMPALLTSCDVVCTTSTWGEGFPNVIGEALACGVPVVATDVGDSALAVGAAGRVVPPGDAQAIAAACGELLALPLEERRALGDQGRRRTAMEFGLPAIAARYAAMYRAVAAGD